MIPGPGGVAAAVRGRCSPDGPPAVLAFEPRRSDLPLQVAFPVLLANLAGELLGGSATPGRRDRARRPGHPRDPRRGHRRPRGAAGRQRRRARGTDGRARRRVTFARTDLLGVYTVTADRRTRTPPLAPSAGLAERRRAVRRRGVARASRRPTFRPADPPAPVRFAVDLLDVDESRDRARRRREADRRSAQPGGRARGRRRAHGAAPPASGPNARDELWIPIVLDRAARPHGRVARLRARHARAAAARRSPRASRRARTTGRGPDGHRVRRPARAPPAAAAARGGHRAPPAPRDGGSARAGGARRSSSACLLLSRPRARARRAPARAAGRPARRRVRRGPVGLGGHGRPRGGARLPARVARGEAATRTSRASSRSAATRSWSGCRPSSPRSTGSPPRPVRGATDIGAALRLAGALFPDDAQKRIVLLSDGNDTTGSGQTEAALAAARGIQVETRLDRPRGRRRGPRRAARVAVHGPPRRVDRGHRPTSRRRSPSRRPRACSSTASSRHASRSTSTAGAQPR